MSQSLISTDEELLLTERPPRFTVVQFMRMVELGAFDGGPRVELLRGTLNEKMTKHAPHTRATSALNRFLTALLTSNCHLRLQDPILLGDSVPEPDGAVVNGTFLDYPKSNPCGEDTLLVIEVADSSYRTDLAKRSLYAQAKIPVYWIINLVHQRVEVYTNPHGADVAAAYADGTAYTPGESVPVVIRGQQVGQIAVNDLLSID